MRKKTIKHDLKVACWNFRIMLDKANSSRHDRLLAHTGHELFHLDIDKSDLSELCLADNGKFQEIGASFTIFLSVKPSTE